MKVNKNYKIELTNEESQALRKLLGSFSFKTKTELGLNKEMCKFSSDLYDELLDINEDNQ